MRAPGAGPRAPGNAQDSAWGCTFITNRQRLETAPKDRAPYRPSPRRLAPGARHPSVPELPEVETIVRDLSPVLPGAVIDGVDVEREDLIAGDPSAWQAELPGRRIDAVSRRAKNIVVTLGELRLVVNLGMTGRLLLAGRGEEEPSHVGVRLFLRDGGALVYRDVRRFGRLELLGAPAWERRAGEMGVEPLSDEFSVEALAEVCRRSRVAIKTRLMDQRRVAGIGNIYASEALFRASIDPRLPAKALDPAQVEALREAVREVLLEAIEYRGTTLLDYRDASGREGGFRSVLRVYGRAGESCPCCGAPIERIIQGGRSTFFCPACQTR